jgi:hypothetical protein
MEIERDLSDAEGRPMNISEYAITGADANGDPIVARVPNTRLLAAAKKGLDSMLEGPGMRDDLTGRFTEQGRAVDSLRRTLLQELRDNNQTYKEANNLWAGETVSIEAMREGQRVFKNTPEENVGYVKDLTPSQQEFFRLGVADEIRKKILTAGLNSDEAKRVINSEWSRRQLRPAFASEAEFKKYIDSVFAERTMFDAAASDVSGSKTAQRLAADAAATEEKSGLAQPVATAGIQAAKGNYLGAAKSMLKAFKLHREMGGKKNEAFEDAVAQILFNPEVTVESLTPRAMPSPARPPVAFSGVPSAVLGTLGVQPRPLDLGTP